MIPPPFQGMGLMMVTDQIYENLPHPLPNLPLKGKELKLFKPEIGSNHNYPLGGSSLAVVKSCHSAFPLATCITSEKYPRLTSKMIR